MFVKWLRAILAITLVTLFGCGGGGGSSSVQVGSLTYTAHDFFLSPSTIKGASASTQLELYVKEQAGSQIKPYSSAEVSFESTCILEGRARVSATRVINGLYSATYTNMGCSGEDVIQANISVGGGAVVAPLEKRLTITDVVQQLSDLTVSAANTNVPADGSSRTLIRVRAVTQSLGLGGSASESGVSGVTVSFSTSKGSLSASQAVTDKDGYANVFLIAATQAGPALVTASAEGFIRTVSVGMGSLTPPARLIVDSGMTIRPNTTAPIRVIALDDFGQPVPSANLVFEVVTNRSGGMLQTYSATTDAAGRAEVTYQAGMTESDYLNEELVLVTGYDQIKVNTSNGVERFALVRVTNRVVVSDSTPSSLTLTTGSNGETVPANDTNVAIVAQVLNLAGNPLSGVSVSFSTTLGVIDTSAITDANGVARVSLKSSTTGVATVTASTQGIVRNTSVTFAPSLPGRSIGELTVTAANTNVPSDGLTQTAIRAFVTSAMAVGDDEVKPLSGVVVNFSTSLGNLTSTSATTDSDGYATVFLVADTQPGTAVVSASSGGFVRTVSVGFGSITPPARIISTVTPGRVNPGTTATIISTVLDATGTGVPNVRLVYEITANISGGRLPVFSAITDALGLASITYVAGNSITDKQEITEDGTAIWVAGYDTITINTNNNVSKTVNVRVNNDLTNFNVLTFTTGGTEVPANNQVSVLLQANVVDGNQQLIAGELVTYTTTLGTLVDINGNAQSTALTGSDGIARLYLRAGPVAEDTEVKVSASYKGVISTQTITFYPNP